MAKTKFKEDELGYTERECDYLADDTREACKEYFKAKRDKKRAEKARKIVHVFANAQRLCENFGLHNDAYSYRSKYKRASAMLKNAANERRMPLCYAVVKEAEMIAETDKHKMAQYVLSIARDIRKMVASELEEWDERPEKD